MNLQLEDNEKKAIDEILIQLKIITKDIENSN